MNYNNLIYKFNKNKYQNYLILKKQFFKSYIASRKNIINFSQKSKDKKIISNFDNNFFKKKNNKKTNTYYDLNIMLKKFKKNKKIVDKDYKKIYLFYKKFETNLVLREKYNKKLNKISNKETNFNSYILLGFFIRKLKKINSIQKINCLMKINDYLIINKFKPINYEIKKILIQNIKYEINYIFKLNKS